MNHPKIKIGDTVDCIKGNLKGHWGKVTHIKGNTIRIVGGSVCAFHWIDMKTGKRMQYHTASNWKSV